MAVKEKETEARRIAQEIRDAEELLKNGDDIYDRPESIDFYTMKRVTEMRLLESVQIAERKISDIKKSLTETHITLKMLEVTNPQYDVEWIDRYNKERSKTSLPAFVPGEHQFDELCAVTLNDLSEKYPEIYLLAKKKLSECGKQEKSEKDAK